VSVTVPFRTLLITSSSPSEGKSTTAANLAVSIAQVGKRVILVDMDLRRPTLHKMFHMENTRGVTSALLQDGVMLTEHVFATEIDNLYLMPSGPQPPKPADLLQTQRAIDLIEGLKSMSDVVILDTPPILAVADPVLLARMCDAALLVVRAETTKIGALRQAKDQLAQSGVNIAGLIFNGITESTDGYYYKYQHYYRSSDEK
jgi:non-specific protein-tyrosine kinase